MQTADPTTVSIHNAQRRRGVHHRRGGSVCLPAHRRGRLGAGPDARAFISDSSIKTKFRGLVNVSGFHVDPGYRGQLTFSVFNAGPVPVHLKRGQPTFLIWYASLDCETAFKKNGTAHEGIDPRMVTAVAGELQSFAGLSKKINDVDKLLRERIHEMEKKQVKFTVIGSIVVGIIVALAGTWLRDALTRLN